MKAKILFSDMFLCFIILVCLVSLAFVMAKLDIVNNKLDKVIETIECIDE